MDSPTTQTTQISTHRLWPAANFVNYAFVPSDLRVLYVNTVFLGWCVILSLLLNRKIEDDEPVVPSSEL